MEPTAGDPQTLFDRFRKEGLAVDLIGEMNRQLKERRRRRRRAIRAAVAGLVVAAGFWVVPYVRDTATIATPAAERRSLALADGSRAELNASTRIQADFRHGRRTVTIEKGEAFFSVAKDPAHPFVVETPRGEIGVVGTKFNVRIGDSGFAEVTLLEGRVVLHPALPAPEGDFPLAPGQQAELAEGAPVPHDLAPAELDQTLAWRQGRIVLDDRRLADVAARLAAFHGCTIIVDAAVADVRLGGTFSIEDLPQLFDALRATGKVNVVSFGENTWRILPVSPLPGRG